MPQVFEEKILITVSRLIKNGSKATPIVVEDKELLTSIEILVQELVGDVAVVEVSNG